MNKRLLLFVQSSNIDLYINILSHCVENEKVKEIYFAVSDEAVGKYSEIKELIRNIRNKLEQLSLTNVIYKSTYNLMPLMPQIDERIIRVVFSHPEYSIPGIKKRFVDMEKFFIDISACNKRLASDIISSFIPKGIKHICCFELEDKVYSKEWIKTKLYHDLRNDISYYEYVDFSEPGTTIKSFNRMRFQGKVIKALLTISILLCLIVFMLIQQQQNVYAQIVSIILAIITGIGLLNDSFSLIDRLK